MVKGYHMPRKVWDEISDPSIKLLQTVFIRFRQHVCVTPSLRQMLPYTAEKNIIWAVLWSLCHMVVTLHSRQ